MRELAKHALRQLRSRDLGPELRGYDRKVNPRCLMPQEQTSFWAMTWSKKFVSRPAGGHLHIRTV